MLGKAFANCILISLISLTGCSMHSAKNTALDNAEDKSKSAPQEDNSGVIHVNAFDLPLSGLMTDESKKAIDNQKKVMKQWAETATTCPLVTEVELAEVAKARECNRANFYASQFYKDLVARYAVDIKPQMIDGVYTEVFTPKAGISAGNKERILINLHGGGFIGGSRSGGQMESIPISALGKIKVISVDYRMAPEYRFPAASEDVVAVYRSLLKKVKPENIGIYGYSAGGVLTSQAIASFQAEGLPLPAAIGMIAGAASDWDGDLMHFGGAIIDYDLFAEPPVDYFEGADMSSPLARPSNSDAVLSKFPPSLLISATRDFALSNVIHTHRQLTRLGVEADLQLWEGMDHGLIAAHYTPEGREAYDVIVKFFDQHLGR